MQNMLMEDDDDAAEEEMEALEAFAEQEGISVEEITQDNRLWQKFLKYYRNNAPPDYIDKQMRYDDEESSTSDTDDETVGEEDTESDTFAEDDDMEDEEDDIPTEDRRSSVYPNESRRKPSAKMMSEDTQTERIVNEVMRRMGMPNGRTTSR
jgi:hypothetical protein